MKRGVATRMLEVKASLMSALGQAGVVGLNVLTAPVLDYRPIEWRAPGIQPMSEVDGVSPTLLARPGVLSLEPRFDAMTEYATVLEQLRQTPETLLTEDARAMRTGAAFGLDQMITRLVFSTPEIVGGVVADDAGAIFAMEFAAACYSAGLGYLVRSHADYYLEAGSFKLGLKNGVPIGYEQEWPLDLSGHVDVYLTIPRGEAWTTNTLDVIDRLYFWAEAQLSQPEAMEGINDILAILKPCMDRNDREILEHQLIRLTPKTVKSGESKAKLKANKLADAWGKLSEAEALMADWRVSDGQRITMLAELLIPAVLSEGAFNNGIYNLEKPIRTLTDRDVKRINKRLEQLKLKSGAAYGR